MRGIQRVLGGIIFLALAVGLAVVPERALPQPSGRAAQNGNDEAIPAYHSEVPKGPLPATLGPSLFAEPVVQNAYRAAARTKKILYQQPCYCHCDRSQGHGSLLDCFVSKHAAECGTCISEAFYSYEQSRKGKTAAQIREGIEQGDWQKVDLTKYLAPLPAK